MFSGVFTSVSDACFKFFICFETYVASVASECFKSRSGVASLSSPFVASPRCLLVFFVLVMFRQRGPAWGRAAWVGRVVRAAWNPNGWDVLHRANTGCGELRPDVELGPNVRTASHYYKIDF